MKRRGFTLVELLVVVSVIALLIAILLPSLRSARDSSKRLLCQTHLRQLASAWHFYLDDYDGHFLEGQNTHLNYGGMQGETSYYQVTKPLNRYLGYGPITEDRLDVFICPGDRGSTRTQPSIYGYYGTSYIMNLMLVGSLDVPSSDPCVDVVRQVKDRQENLRLNTLFASDALVLLMGDFGWYYAWSWRHSGGWRVDFHRRPCHYNLAFLDGHVEFLRVFKGLNVTARYTVIPFQDLQSLSADCQECSDLDPCPGCEDD